MKIVQHLLLCILLAAGGTASAMSRKSALSTDIINLGRFIQLYHDERGEYPKSWIQLEKVFPNLDVTFSSLKPTQRMTLVTPPFELPKRYTGGMVLAISREAFKPQSWEQWPIFGIVEYLEDPSYAVIVAKDGGVFLRHLPPDAARSVFKDVDRALPEASGLGAFPHEKKFMARRTFNWVGMAAIAFWLIWSWIRMSKIRKRERGLAGNTP